MKYQVYMVLVKGLVCQLILDQVELEIVQMKRVLDLFRLVKGVLSGLAYAVSGPRP
jgi:hypothetical protein